MFNRISATKFTKSERSFIKKIDKELLSKGNVPEADMYLYNGIKANVTKSSNPIVNLLDFLGRLF